MTDAPTESRSPIRQHIYAALAGLVAVFGAGALVITDRADPLIFTGGSISPEVVGPGNSLSVTWFARWQRPCAGTVRRQIVGSDRVIRSYSPHGLSAPAQLGPQSPEAQFRLPDNIPSGGASYRAVVSFDRCGFTSRWLPLEVEAPRLTFDVVRP